MTPLRRLLALLGPLVLGAGLLAALPAASSARGAACAGDAPIAARSLTGRAAAMPACSLAGRTVYAGRVSVVVPPAGMSVAGDGYGTHGEPVGLRVTNTGTGVRAWTGAARTTPAPAPKLDPGACQDRTFHLIHHRWASPYRYRIRVGSIPSRFHRATVVRQIQAADANMRLGRNTCGKPTLGTPPAHYLGATKARPDITSSTTSVSCGDYDTGNVIGFGTLPGDLLGWTCVWWLNTGRMAASDMLLDHGPRLATTLPAHCIDSFDFEGTVTHEFGHAYGLLHTGPGHANLTMQHEGTPCSTYARTLGLGDWLGMKKMYGER